jgi:hypothetical protein
MGQKNRIRIRDDQPGSYSIFPRAWKQIFWVKILKLLDGVRDIKKNGSGMENIRIRDKHPESPTLP